VSVALPVLHVGRGTQFGAITAFPAWTDALAPSGLVTGPAAQVEVAECAGHPVVNTLVLTNHGDEPVLLVEGELLEGGWQHRALQHDIVLGPGQSLPADVACVEAGRWQSNGPGSRRGRRASPTVRAALSGVAVNGRQQEVWRRVAGYEASLGPSQTSSYVDQLERFDSTASSGLDALANVRRVRPLPGQRGIVVGVAGYPVIAELYPSVTALRAHLRELLASVLLDATALLSGVESVPARRVHRFIAHLDEVNVHADPDVNAGAAQMYSADTKGLVVRGTLIADRWAHISVLNRNHPLLQL
jgi:hypothetical protein